MDDDRHGLNPSNQLPRWLIAVLATGPIAFLIVFYAWPFLTLISRGIDGAAISETLSRGATWRIVWFTSWQAVVSTVLTLMAGLAPTWAVSRYDFPGRRLFISAVTAMFVLPTVVVGAAIVALLPASLDRSVWAIFGAHVVFNLAVVLRTVGPAWEQIPAELEWAAATLGARPWQRFITVTLPLLRPALTSAAAIVFLFTFTSYGVIRILGTAGRSTIEVEVWRRATQLGDVGGAAVLAVLQLAVLAGLVVWSTRQQRRSAVTVRLSTRPVEGRPRGRTRWLVASSVAVTVAMTTVPLAALVERSFSVDGSYSLAAWKSLGNDEVRPGLRLGLDPVDAIWNSLTTAAWATLFATLIGGLAVVALTTLGRSGRFLDTGLMLPLGTSAVTIGFGMLITFDVPPFDWRAAWWLVPVGHALVATPFVVRSAMAVARSIDTDQRHAAATLGASPIAAWLTTTLPTLRRPLVAGAGLAAAVSFGEFGATSFLSRTGSDTLPIAIERLLGRTGRIFQAQAFALSSLLAGATIAVVLLVDAGGERGR